MASSDSPTSGRWPSSGTGLGAKDAPPSATRRRCPAPSRPCDRIASAASARHRQLEVRVGHPRFAGLAGRPRRARPRGPLPLGQVVRQVRCLPRRRPPRPARARRGPSIGHRLPHGLRLERAAAGRRRRTTPGTSSRSSWRTSRQLTPDEPAGGASMSVRPRRFQQVDVFSPQRRPGQPGGGRPRR